MVFDAEPVEALLRRQKIATLAEMKDAMGTSATMTVFRKLKALGYRTSYSHRGKYYTLMDIPEFDEQGLWFCRATGFSRDGNLLATTQRFVEQAAAGITAGELHGMVSVEVKEPLLQLYRRKRIDRQEIEGQYVYFARQAGIGRQQRLQRESPPGSLEIGDAAVQTDLSPELKTGIILFFSLLDEQQRRLYAGLEAHKIGHGGDARIAEFLGLDAHTVARGRRELFESPVDRQRVRKKGGGRKLAEKKRRK
jgi:hypothetical protein